MAEKVLSTDRHRKRPEPNGKKCVLCGGNLFDTRPGEVVQIHPPMFETRCASCGNVGKRLANES